MRRSVWLALAASLLHGKAAGFLELHSSAGISGATRAARCAPRRGLGVARGTGSCPGVGASPARLDCTGWAAGFAGKGSWGAPPPAFPEQPARLFCLEVSLQGEFQRKLYKELVRNYNPLERPVANDSQPLTVYFSLSLMQIMDVVSPGAAPLGPRGRGSGGQPGGVAWPRHSSWPRARRAPRCCVPQSPHSQQRNR